MASSAYAPIACALALLIPPMIADVMNIFDDEATADFLTPMARAGTPMEMAYGVLYLASDEATYCNGVVLPIDGGTVARQ